LTDDKGTFNGHPRIAASMRDTATLQGILATKT
jgi:hypothetical protein